MAQSQADRPLTYVQAVNEALRQEMERDPAVFIMGEDIAGAAGRPDKQDAWGGPMRITFFPDIEPPHEPLEAGAKQGRLEGVDQEEEDDE